MTVTSSSPPPSGSNLVANGNFATGDFTDWTLGGNDSNASSPQLYIDTNAEGGSTYAVGMGSMGARRHLKPDHRDHGRPDLYAELLAAERGVAGNDFAAIWNGQTLLSLTNAAQFGYTEYTYTVTATGSTTTLEFSAAIIQASGIRQYLADGEWNVVDAATRRQLRSSAAGWQIPMSR